MEKQINELHSKARELLASGEVKVVIGWAKGSTSERTRPIFITNPEDVEQLVWNGNCRNNLSIYLVRKEIRTLGKTAILAKGCDVKSIVALIQESQIKREDVFIFGLSCDGIGETICSNCDVRTPPFYDVLIGEEKEPTVNGDFFENVAEMEKRTFRNAGISGRKNLIDALNVTPVETLAHCATAIYVLSIKTGRNGSVPASMVRETFPGI